MEHQRKEEILVMGCLQHNQAGNRLTTSHGAAYPYELFWTGVSILRPRDVPIELYPSTTMIQFWVPNSLERRIIFIGSSHQTPSTTKRYSCSPGSTYRLQLHVPSSSWTSGLAMGFHSLKHPTTKTCDAWGALSVNVVPGFLRRCVVSFCCVFFTPGLSGDLARTAFVFTVFADLLTCVAFPVFFFPWSFFAMSNSFPLKWRTGAIYSI